MAAILGDFLRINMLGSIFGQDTLNVFYYRVVSLTGFTNDGYSAILDDFDSSVIETLFQAVSADYALKELTINNVTNGIDFAVKTFAAGTRNGEQLLAALPSYVNYTFRLQRESIVTRNGYKRFTGVPESFVTGNQYVGTSNLMTNIENELKADIVLGAVQIAEPVIVKRPLPSIVPQSHPYASVGGCDFRGIGTQNTRKTAGWQ